MTQVETAQIAQLDPFELLPEPLTRIEFGGVCRQAFQVDTLGCPIRQESFDDMAAVDRRAIPENHHPARDLAQQMLEKRDDVCGIERAVLAVEVQLTLGRYRGDGREMVAGVPLPQDGGLADWGVGTHDTREGIKPGLIYEEDGLLLGFRPLLRAGQMSSRQRVIAASSRWRARRTGFCGLQRIALQRRPTWVGW